mmetsp:Transcript_24284/g.76223  ORF Transcript_24284/g.76223 Transcript_24284/m.76223 type:complete len:93 (-) Transcript_24284:1368-1646(-)
MFQWHFTGGAEMLPQGAAVVCAVAGACSTACVCVPCVPCSHGNADQSATLSRANTRDADTHGRAQRNTAHIHTSPVPTSASMPAWRRRSTTH